LVADNVRTYQTEAEAISQAQTNGTTGEVANVLASLANAQFTVYRIHFAGQSRLSRRPALLVRIIDALEIIQDRMVRLKTGGLNEGFHDKNLLIVEEQLRMYKTELDEIRKARKGAALVDLMGELGGAANQIFEEYRASFAGKNRSNVDRAKLGEICDRLYEIARQMEDMRKVEPNDMNEKNLQIVLGQLGQFETEFEAVSQVQQQKK
jgi:hypothetical protein